MILRWFIPVVLADHLCRNTGCTVCVDIGRISAGSLILSVKTQNLQYMNTNMIAYKLMNSLQIDPAALILFKVQIK